MGWVADLRNNAGISLVELHKRLAKAGYHKSDAALSLWEQENRLPATLLGNPTLLLAYAQALDVSVATILYHSGYAGDLNLTTDFDPEVLRIANRLQALDETQRSEVLQLINNMLNVVTRLSLTSP